MITTRRPTHAEMDRAMRNRDTTYEGVFFIAVRTTGIFCRPGCPARTPRSENVEFFFHARDALSGGYRPCRRCHPLQPRGAAPPWLAGLLADIEADPSRRLTDADLRARDLEPATVRRWFKAHHGMTFQAYHRARRMGLAQRDLHRGGNLTHAAFDHGFDSNSGFREAFTKTFGDAPGRSRDGDPITILRLDSPLGPLMAGATRDAICLLEFADRERVELQLRRLQRHLPAPLVPGRHELLDQVAGELEQYFAGQRTTFTVPLEMPGTDFQRTVWQQLTHIPYGETRSYDQLARAAGHPGSQRAAGRANGDNRLAILVPCHRVVRSDGTLSGYGGGVWRKEWLLDHERRHRPGSNG